MADIKVDVFNGPIGGHGFRSGWWPVTIDGQKARVYSSVPHSAELDEQERTVRRAVEQCLAKNEVGPTKNLRFA